jgi:RecA-family ATPase
MTAPIKAVTLPKSEIGNDSNDYRNDVDYIEKLQPKSLIQAGSLPKNIDTLSIPKRPFIIDGRLLRGTVSCIAGPPGVGKSAFEVATMISVASGISYLGEPILETGKYWLYNNEEDIAELYRRYIGFCKFHNIVPSSLRENVWLSSGYGSPLIIAGKCSHTGEVIATPHVDELIQIIKDQNIMALSVDPLVSTHQTDENNNVEAEQVMSRWRHIAAETNCAINLPAHIAKLGRGNESDSFAGNLDAMRGASAVAGAARQVHTLARMSKKTAKTYGIESEERIHMVRLDATKGNYTPPAENTTWLRMRGQCLNNDQSEPDWVGVFTEYQGTMAKPAGVRDQANLEGAAVLRLALSRLDLKRGHQVPVGDVAEKLMSYTKRSRTWINERIPRYLEEHGTRVAEAKEVEFTWSKEHKKTGGKKQLVIHRETYV